jgi:hypothetical protein
MNYNMPYRVNITLQLLEVKITTVKDLHDRQITMTNKVSRKKSQNDDQTLGSVVVGNGIPVTTTALPARSAKSSPSLT